MKEPTRKTRVIVKKEFLALRRDKISLFFTILVPVLIVVAYGMSFEQEDPVISTNLNLGVVNEDGDLYYTKQLENSFLNSSLVSASLNPSQRDAKNQLLEGGIVGVVIIPTGFNQSFRKLVESLGASNQTTPEIKLLFDDSKHTISPVIQAKVLNITTEFIEAFGVTPLTINTISLTQKNLSTKAAAIGTILGIAIFFACFDDIASALAREREKGTLLRLFLSRVSRWEVFAGKLISSLLLTLLRISLLLFIILTWFEIDIQGDIWMIYFVGLLIAINTIGLGFIISSRNISERAVVIINFAAMVPLLFLTGVLQPIDMMPETTRMMTWWIPFTQSNDALRRIIHLGQGITYSIVQQEMIYLILAAVLEYSVAALLWKRRIE